MFAKMRMFVIGTITVKMVTTKMATKMIEII